MQVHYTLPALNPNDMATNHVLSMRFAAERRIVATSNPLYFEIIENVLEKQTEVGFLFKEAIEHVAPFDQQ